MVYYLVMHDYIAVIAGCITVAAAIPYIRDTLKGKTHPNVVTWFTWTLLNVINSAAAWSSGAIQTAIFTTAGGLATGLILLAGLRRGFKNYTMFDAACQVTVIAGVVLWKLTEKPGTAVMINLGVDFAGLLPTYRHVLKSPGAETWQMFAITAAAAALTLLSIQHYSFVAIAPPAYIFGANIITVSTILFLRRSRLQAMASVSGNGQL